MRKILGLFLVAALIGLALPASAVQAQVPLPPLPENCYVLPSGMQSVLVCLPPAGVPWNGDAVVFAHGYVAPTLPLEYAWLQLNQAGVNLPQLVTGFGFVLFAPTYSKTGLAVTEGLADTLGLGMLLKAGMALPVDLTLPAGTVLPIDVGPFPAGTILPVHLTLPAGTVMPPFNRVFLTGASEGGLITALAMETPSTPFNAGLAACGPIGDFGEQINYLGDFRVLFDYFFAKKVLPGNPVTIPDSLFFDWLSGDVAGDPFLSRYQAAVLTALQADPAALGQLIAVSQAPVDPLDPSTTAALTTLRVLHYNMVATMDAQVELGVQPYTNVEKVYSGSLNDELLNRRVQRIQLHDGKEAALAAALVPYQTDGQLSGPLVTLHTLYDPEVPFWHEVLYQGKQPGPAPFVSIPVARYGHCNFTATDLTNAFMLTVSMAAP